MSRPYQLATDPLSPVMMQFSGSRLDASQNTRCGLIGSADCMARSSSVFHQLATPLSMSRRQRPGFFCSSSGSSARSAVAVSPTMFTSIG